MSSAQTQTTVNGNGSQIGAKEKLLKELEVTNTLPLWPQMAVYNPPLPNPKTVPFLWDYDQIKPYLVKAGELVKDREAERRVLMLVNPATGAPYTTDTLYAGLQLVMPNETAPAHRHSAFAARFVIEGNGGFTAVQGKRIVMNRADVILTPTWNWHDHGKDGSGPMIWLDALDLPLFQSLPIHFVEHYKDLRYPADDVDTSKSPIVFPWARMKEQLDSASGNWASKPYLKADGEEVSKTIGLSAERIDKGTSSPAVQETASAVVHVISGTGFSELNGKKFVWKQGDTLAIPAWCKYQHFAGPDENVYLYRFDDKPMLKSLGFYRWDGIDVEKLVT